MDKQKKETVGTKYLLIAFGDFSENQQLMADLFSQFTPILSSNFLKFHFGNDYVISHFETEEKQKDIKHFCNEVLGETVCNYILLPYNKNVMVSLPTELKEFLFDLDTNSGFEAVNKSDLVDLHEDEDFMEQLLEQLKNQKETKPSLDELLDKIQAKGIDQLTKKEKKQLYDYSKGI